MEVVDARMATARLMDALLEDCPGVQTPKTTPGSEHVYWKYCLRIDPDVLEGGVDAFAMRLRELGISCAPRYIQKPAFMCEVIREQRTFGDSGFPFRGPHRAGLPEVVYRPEDYPGTYDALAHVCVLPWNEFYTDEHVQHIADAVLQVAEDLS